MTTVLGMAFTSHSCGLSCEFHLLPNCGGMLPGLWFCPWETGNKTSDQPSWDALVVMGPWVSCLSLACTWVMFCPNVVTRRLLLPGMNLIELGSQMRARQPSGESTGWASGDQAWFPARVASFPLKPWVSIFFTFMIRMRSLNSLVKSANLHRKRMNIRH